MSSTGTTLPGVLGKVVTRVLHKRPGQDRLQRGKQARESGRGAATVRPVEAIQRRGEIVAVIGDGAVRLGWRTNPSSLVGVAAELAILLLLAHAPLRAVFGVTGPGWQHWLTLAALPPTLLLEEARKALARWRGNSKA